MVYRKRDYLALGFFVFFVLLVGWRIVFCGEVIFTGDNFDLIFPQKNFLVEEIRNGRFPFWNPYILSGTPYFADLNLGTLSPTNIFYFLVEPAEKAGSLILLIDLFLIGFFTYLSARFYRISYFGSVVSGISFMCSGIILAYITNLAILNVVVFVPIIFYFLEKALMTRSYRLILFCALLFFGEIISGHAQITYYTGFLIAALILSKKYILLKEKVKISLLFFLPSLLLASVQLFPFVELARLTPRVGGSYEWATRGSLSFFDLLKFFFPKFIWLFTDWVDFALKVNIGYVGVVPLVLMLVAFGTAGKRFRLLKAMVLVALLFALGKNTPFYKLFYFLLPGLSFLKVPSQAVSFYSFGASILAGCGLDELVKGVKSVGIRKEKATQFLKILSGLFFVFFWLCWFFVKKIGFLADFFGSYKTAVLAINAFCLLIGLVVFFIAVLLLKLKNNFWGLTIILVAVIVDGFLTSRAVLLTAPFEKIRAEAVELPNFDRSLYRIYTPSSFLTPLWQIFSPRIEEVFAYQKRRLYLPNQNINEKVLALDGYASMALASYIDQFNRSVETVTGLGRIDLERVDFARYAVKFIVFSDRVDEVLEPRKRFFLEEGGEAVLTSETPSEFNFIVDSPVYQNFVLLDNYYPGWRAYIDGVERPVEVFEKNYRKVAVLPGRHFLTFKFFPKTFYYGLVFSSLGFLLIVVLFFLLKGKKF